MSKFVAYYRVSTQRQGASGLGLEAQEKAVAEYLAAHRGRLVSTFTEIESGKRTDRPQLALALAHCRATGATLVVAKLDRLARNARFLLTLVEESGKAGVVFCDLPAIPDGPTGKFLLTQMASVAELEAGLISQRTKAALAAAKARGQVLGRRDDAIASYAASGAIASASVRRAEAAKRNADLHPLIAEARANGARTLRAIGEWLNTAGIQPPRGERWHANTVRRALAA